MEGSKSIVATLLVCVLLAVFTTGQGTEDPRSRPNLSPFEQWDSAYDCLQNTSGNCPNKYQLTVVGWANVTSNDTVTYCTGGWANHTRDVLKCLDDVMRGNFKFENKQTVNDVYYTITEGCSKGFTGHAQYLASSARMMTATHALAFTALFAISYIFIPI